MKIYIKNIVCPLFVHFVKSELQRLSISHTKLNMNEIEVAGNLSEASFNQLNAALLNYGLDIEIDRKDKIVLKIKTLINEYIENQKLELEMNLYQFINLKLNENYELLDATFLEATGMSIEKYFKWRKINVAIKLLMHYKLTISEITYQLNYKNEKELLRQFKMEIGIIPEIGSIRARKNLRNSNILSASYC